MIHASSSKWSAISMLACAKLGIHFSVVFEDLAKEGNDKQNDLPYERVMALIVRLLDTTFIRIGNETSRDDKEKATYGLSTMQDEHIDFEPTDITEEEDKWYDSQVGGKFTFIGKSNKYSENENESCNL